MPFLRSLPHPVRSRQTLWKRTKKKKHLRAILNYGHTLGHAIETVTDYKKYRHGEAVAIGMLYATRVAIDMGLTDNTVLEQQLSLIKRLGLPLHTGLKPEEIVKTLYADKKVIAGQTPFYPAHKDWRGDYIGSGNGRDSLSHIE